MDRRTLMKSAASSAFGACLLGGMTDHAMNARAATLPARPRIGDFIDTADGVKLAYTDWGSGKPVVFVHAWALPSPMWDYQIGALAQAGLRCIAYDRRGHGRSSKPGSGYDCDTLADDLSALMTQLDLQGVTLVSHSFGSGEVVRYLTRHGAGRTRKLPPSPRRRCPS
jgi:non-heme chloroperoxidase